MSISSKVTILCVLLPLCSMMTFCAQSKSVTVATPKFNTDDPLHRLIDVQETPHVNIRSKPTYTNTTTAKQGFDACGALRTTSSPTLLLSFSDVPDDLTVTWEGGNTGVIVHPSGQVTCMDSNKALRAIQWERNAIYAYYPTHEFSSDSGLLTDFSITSPSGNEELIQTYFQKPLSISSTQNPVLATVSDVHGLFVQKNAMGIDSCKRLKTATPLASIHVETPSSYMLIAEDHASVHVQLEDGTCMQTNLTYQDNKVALPKGTHRLWLYHSQERDKPRAATALLIQDVELALGFDDTLPTFDPADPTSRLLIAAAPPQDAAFNTLCNKPLTAPAVFLKRSAPAKQEEPLVLLDHVGPVTVIGPMEAQFEKGSTICHHNTLPPDQGMYAIFPFINSTEQVSVALALGQVQDSERLELVRPVPSDSTLDERVISTYYGRYLSANEISNHSSTSKALAVEALYEAAPGELFVFSKESRNGVATHEPLLIASVKQDEVQVVRLDGQLLTLRKEALSTTPPASIALPPVATLEKPKKFEHVPAIMAPLQKSIYVSHLDERERYKACTKKWFEDQKVAWINDSNLIFYNPHTGRTLQDKLWQKASKSCKLDLLKKNESKAIDTIYDARVKAQGRALKALDTKFN